MYHLKTLVFGPWRGWRLGKWDLYSLEVVRRSGFWNGRMAVGFGGRGRRMRGQSGDFCLTVYSLVTK